MSSPTEDFEFMDDMELLKKYEALQQQMTSSATGTHIATTKMYTQEDAGYSDHGSDASESDDYDDDPSDMSALDEEDRSGGGGDSESLGSANSFGSNSEAEDDTYKLEPPEKLSKKSYEAALERMGLHQEKDKDDANKLPYNATKVMPRDFLDVVPTWDGTIPFNSDRDGSLTTIFGKSGSGKSYLIDWIMTVNRKKWHSIIYMSNEPRTRRRARRRLPKNHVMPFRPNVLLRILDKYEERVEAGQVVPAIAFIIDDCADTKEARGGVSSPLEMLAQRGRHLSIDTFVLTQSCMKLSGFIRAQTMYCMSGNFEMINEIQALRRYWFGGHPWFGKGKQCEDQWHLFFRSICQRTDLTNLERKLVMWKSVDGSIPAELKLYKVIPGKPDPDVDLCHSDMWALDFKSNAEVAKIPKPLPSMDRSKSRGPASGTKHRVDKKEKKEKEKKGKKRSKEKGEKKDASDRLRYDVDVTKLMSQKRRAIDSAKQDIGRIGQSARNHATQKKEKKQEALQSIFHGLAKDLQVTQMTKWTSV